jgi:hypothetical protein
MQNTSNQRPDYAALFIPGRDAQPIEVQARNLLISVQLNKSVIAEEYDREYFEQKLALKFNRNTAVSALRAQHPKSMRQARKAFYDFTIAAFQLETTVRPEIEEAIITIIANEALKNSVAAPTPQLQPAKHETKKPRKRAYIAPVEPKTKKPQQRVREKVLRKKSELPKNLLHILEHNSSVHNAARKIPSLMPAIMGEFSNFYEKALELNDKTENPEKKHLITPEILDAVLSKIVKKILRDHRRNTTRPLISPTKFTAKNGRAIGRETKKRFKDPEFLSEHKQKMKDVHKDPAYVLFRAVQISEGVKRRYEENPDYTTSVSEGLKEHYEDPKNIAAHSRRMKKRHEDPVYAAAHLKRLEKVWADTEKKQVGGNF